MASELLMGWAEAAQIMNPTVASAPPSEIMRASIVAVLPDLRRRAAHLASSPAAADDLVQDTVERALRFADRYDPGSNLRGWAYQVLFSVFVTGYRRRRRDTRCRAWLATNPSAWPHRSPFPSAETTLGLTRRTADAIARLPDPFREVVTLVDVEDQSYREAARRLAIPVGTVMSRLHRGRKLLAGLLGREGEGAVAA